MNIKHLVAKLLVTTVHLEPYQALVVVLAFNVRLANMEIFFQLHSALSVILVPQQLLQEHGLIVLVQYKVHGMASRDTSVQDQVLQLSLQEIFIVICVVSTLMALVSITMYGQGIFTGRLHILELLVWILNLVACIISTQRAQYLTILHIHHLTLFALQMATYSAQP